MAIVITGVVRKNIVRRNFKFIGPTDIFSSNAGIRRQNDDLHGWGNTLDCFNLERVAEYSPASVDLSHRIFDPVLQQMLVRLKSMHLENVPLKDISYVHYCHTPYLKEKNDWTHECWSRIPTTEECYEDVNDRADFLQGYIHYGPADEHTRHCGFEICRSQRCSSNYSSDQLNGSNGEWTGTDDLKKISKSLQKQGLQSKRKKQRKQLARSAVRIASSVAGAYVGEENVKLARMALASVGRSRKANSSPSEGVTLGACASRLLQSYVDPFTADQVCIPKPPGNPTWKLRVMQRGVAFIGESGFGYVAAAPSLVNDTPTLFFTTSNFTGKRLTAPAPNLSFNDMGASNTTPSCLAINNPFSTSHLIVPNPDSTNRQIQGRICSASLRVQYAGKSVDQQGLIVGYCDPSGTGVLGDQVNWAASGTTGNGYDMSELMALPYADVELNKRQMCLAIVPDNDAATDFPNAIPLSTAQEAEFCYPYCNKQYYQDLATPSFPNPRRCGSATAVIAFTGTPGSSVYFEYVQHIEYSGPGIPIRSLTPSEIDLNGSSVVRDVVNRARVLQYSSNGLNFQQCVKQAMRERKIKFGKGYLTK